MSTTNLILDLKDDPTDAVETLRHAAEVANEISGEDAGRLGDPENGIPEILPVEGWPAFVTLAAILDELARLVDAAATPEIREAISAAEKEADEAPEPIQPGDYRYYQAH